MQEHLWGRALSVKVRLPAEGFNLFDPGPFYASAGALALERDGICSFSDLAGKHLEGDWGDIPEDYKKENAAAAERGWRVVSEHAVALPVDRVLVVTEADRSGTTFITAEEWHKGKRNGRMK